MSYLHKLRLTAQRQGVVVAVCVAIRFFIRRAGLRAWSQPYEYVQSDVQRNLHRYLGVDRHRVCRIVIVGAHMADEVDRMLKAYPNATFRLFEPSPRYLERLGRRFLRNSRVQVHGCAISDSDGSCSFHETNLEGSGSILKLGEFADQSHGLRQGESYVVQSLRLDTHARENCYDAEEIDCLWIDVQGAELLVLRGAEETLQRVRSVFIEVAVFRPVYEGGAMFPSLRAVLEDKGLSLVALGVDAENGTGNAFFVRGRRVDASMMRDRAWAEVSGDRSY
jgi:FkbM family methyltransferase